MSDELMESNPLALINTAQTQGMVTWSEEKKKDFVNTFKDRSEVAKFILTATAEKVLETAKDKHYISSKHIPSKYQCAFQNYRYYGGAVGGRSRADLLVIATERAKLIIDQLPSLNKAVSVIYPITAKNMEKRDALLAKGKVILSKLEDLSETIDTAELDQKMTIGDFRAMVKDRNKQRKVLAAQLDEIGEEGLALENLINKALYKGLPGLSEAVIDVVNSHMERVTAIDTMNRRVAEKVMFGDSDAALELLGHFESDEIEVGDKIKQQFAAAMEKLNLASKKKSLKAKD